MECSNMVDCIKDMLLSGHASPAIIQLARLVVAINRGDVPDYVKILANGNPAFFEAVIQTAIDDMKFEEQENGKSD